MTFTLDTSGIVPFSRRVGPITEDGTAWYGPTMWDDLDPFTQGYTLAALEALAWATSRIVRFRDLAPETLATILRDCAAAESFGGTVQNGRDAWNDRQNGSDPHFPPLVPYLGDDGKVYLREAVT